jgi:hypothetical protein
MRREADMSFPSISATYRSSWAEVGARGACMRGGREGGSNEGGYENSHVARCGRMRFLFGSTKFEFVESSRATLLVLTSIASMGVIARSRAWPFATV